MIKGIHHVSIGKDTARIYLNPAAMTAGIAVKDFENELYGTLSMRSESKETDAKGEREYKGAVTELVRDLRDDTGVIGIQDRQNVAISRKGIFKPDEIMKRDAFVFFGEEKKGAASSSPDIRCYVTVKEDKQKEMVSRLREHMNQNEKFKGAFEFKLMSTSNAHRLDNIVIYLNSKKHDPKLFKEFIEGFSEKIKDIATDNENIPTTCSIKKGIGISTEPTEVYRHLYRIATTFDAELPDSVKKGIEEYPYDNKLIHGPVEDEAVNGKVRISWNEYCSRLLVMSSYIARHRLGRKDKDTSVTQDAEVKKEMDKVYQEFMVLSGIDPATMMLKSNEQFFKTLTSK